MSYPIVVHSVLKGNKSINQGDTIELISEMPSDWGFIEDTLVYIPTELNPLSFINGIKLGVKTRGVYFLKKPFKDDLFLGCISIKTMDISQLLG